MKKRAGILRKKVAKSGMFFLGLLILLCIMPCSVQAQVRLNKKTAVMTAGTKLKLKLKGTKKKVKWKSANRKVATVSAKGVVNAKNQGKVRIVARVEGKKYICSVTVLANEFWGVKSHDDGTMSSEGVAYFVSKLSYSGKNLICEGFFRNTTVIDIPAGTKYTITVIDEKNRVLGTGSYKTAGVIKSNGFYDEKIIFLPDQQKAAGVDLRKIVNAGAEVEMEVVQTEVTETSGQAAQ